MSRAVGMAGGPSGDSASSQATPQEQVGALGMPAVRGKRADMDSLSRGKSGGYGLSVLFMTLAYFLSCRYQRQKGCLPL